VPFTHQHIQYLYLKSDAAALKKRKKDKL